MLWDYGRCPEGPHPQQQKVPVAQGLRLGVGSVCFMGTEFWFWEMRKFWRQLVGMVVRQCECA